MRLDELLLGDLGNTRVDARLLQALMLRDGKAGVWLRNHGVTAQDVEKAFSGTAWD